MSEPSASSGPQQEPRDQSANQSQSAQSSPIKHKWFNPTFVKVAMVAVIFGLLQIPLSMIEGTIAERQTYNSDYPNQYQGYGAGKQSIVGPILTVPYKYQIVEEKQLADGDYSGASNYTSTDDSDGKTVKFTKTYTSAVHFFPENLDVNGTLIPEIRDGGKFKNILYTADVNFKGKFDTADLATKNIKESDLMWDQAFLAVGVADLRGIREETKLTWGEQEYKFMPGTNGLGLVDAGQYTLLPAIKKGGVYPFSFTLHLKGSRDFELFPGGKENTINLRSSWKDPTFEGGFLPSLKKSDDTGFDAQWKVSYFNRNFPQMWTDQDRDLRNSMAQYMVTVVLATPVDFYRTSIRAVKYGCMFIVMPFLVFFLFEIMARVRIHEMNYLLVGLALSLFFLVLIAISEYIPFVWAYDLASTLTIGQITWYTYAFSKVYSPHLWKIMAASLTALYSYLYILLQLEDMSLLFGALGLFIALSVVLWATRNINWYAPHQVSGEKQPA